MKFCLALLVVGFSSAAFAWTVESVKGDVSLQAKSKKSAPAVKGVVLEKGFGLTTGKDGHVLIRDGESQVWLAPKTKFVLKTMADTEKDELGELDLLSGLLRAKFKRPSGPDDEPPYRVKAKSVMIGRGSEFVVSVEGVHETVGSVEGTARASVIGEAEFWDVPSGKYLSIKPREMPKVHETTPAVSKGWNESTSI